MNSILNFISPLETNGKKHGPLYMIYHRIRSTMSLGAICKQSKVSTILNKHNVSINLHIWKEDEVDIVNLGFHVAADPYNQLKTHFEAAIRRQITTMTGTQLDKIPYFQTSRNHFITIKLDDQSLKLTTSSAAEPTLRI